MLVTETAASSSTVGWAATPVLLAVVSPSSHMVSSHKEERRSLLLQLHHSFSFPRVEIRATVFPPLLLLVKYPPQIPLTLVPPNGVCINTHPLPTSTQTPTGRHTEVVIHHHLGCHGFL